MHIRTKTMIATGAVALAGVGAFGASSVANAATTQGTSLASAIASKFGLKQADVQAVIDMQHQQMDATRQAEYTAKLDAAVKAGTITEDQKSKIIAKNKELQAARTAAKDSMQTMTDDQRKAAMDKARTDLQTWAKDNNIPMNLLMMGGHGGMHGGRHGEMEGATEGADDGTTTSPSPSPAATN